MKTSLNAVVIIFAFTCTCKNRNYIFPVWIKKTKRKCLGTLSLQVRTWIRKKIEVKTAVSNWQGVVLRKIRMYTEGPTKTVLLGNALV